MICRNPYLPKGGMLPYGCGQCLPCRLNKRRIWTHRIMLEALQHSENCFVTLTYADEYLPADLSVSPAVLSAFVKRLRTSLAPRKLRFYGVGEYGDKFGRPHYHLALFGAGQCSNGRSSFTSRRGCCVFCNNILACWGSGFVDVGELNPESAAYLGGYVVKKMTREDDERLEGRSPEFARMSLKPGIGAGAMDEVASVLLTYGVGDDVPVALRHGKRLLPLGVYLRKRLRERVGRDVRAPQATVDALAEELSELRKAAEGNPEAPRSLVMRDLIFRDLVIESGEGRYRNMKARHDRKRRSL